MTSRAVLYMPRISKHSITMYLKNEWLGNEDPEGEDLTPWNPIVQ